MPVNGIEIKEKESTVKFNPKPGDKIICNNGDEAVCCTLEFLRTTISPRIISSEPILGYFEDENGWQDWDENGRSPDSDYDYSIREVIPQAVKEEPKFTVREALEAVRDVLHFVHRNGMAEAEKLISDYLKKKSDPEYLKYLELKVKYEGK